MKHHKTIHIRPDGSTLIRRIRPPEKKQYATPGESYYIRFCCHTYHNTCAQMDLLARAFTDAQLHYDDHPNQESFYISIIVTSEALDKYKIQDHETSMDRIEWIIHNFQPPSIQLIISIYVSDTVRPVESGFFTSTVWPLRKRWNIENTKKKVTCQEIEGNNNSYWKLRHTYSLIDLTKNLADHYEYDIEFINYTYNYEDVLKHLLESKIHFGYIGASYFIAAAAGVPTLGFGMQYNEVEHNGELIRTNLFGNAQTSFTSMRQRNLKTLQVEERPLTTSYGTCSPLHVLDEFYRLEDIVPTKRNS